MTLTVSGNTVRGTVRAPASKSAVHRLLICAALADAPTVLTGVTRSEDIDATIACLTALGASVTVDGDRLAVSPLTAPAAQPVLDCGESGSTIRFLLPIVAALGGGAQCIGRGRLAQRPLSPLYELLTENGCTLSPQRRFPLTLTGQLRGSRFAIDGGVSSQFISGLLMAAPLLDTDVEIHVTGTVESRPYIDITVAALRCFGVTVREDGNTFFVPRGSRYRSPHTVHAEGDWSNAAFWLVAGAIAPHGDLCLAALDEHSKQGDKAIVSLLRDTGVTVAYTDEGVRCADKPQRPFCVDVSHIPDLVPILAVLAAAIDGRSVIGNAARLKLKESDRLASVHAMLTALGGSVALGEDFLEIHGTGRLSGGTVDACGDHRIAMAAAVAACICDESVTIVGAEAVKKSYPHFFAEWASKEMSVCPPYSGET